MADAPARSCPHCGAQARSDAAYCEACGKALPSPDEPRIVSGRAAARTGVGRRFQTASLQKQMRRASGALLAVAILQVLGLAVLYFALREQFDDPEVGGILKAMVIGQSVVVLAFFGLWRWSRRSPLPAAIVGLVVYLTLLFASALAEPKSLFSGVIVKVIIIVVLIQAISAGARYRRLEEEEAAAGRMAS